MIWAEPEEEPEKGVSCGPGASIHIITLGLQMLGADLHWSPVML